MSKSNVLRHIVMMQFKDSASDSDVNEVVKRFTRLEELIAEVDGLEWGINTSPENLDDGLTHCFNLTFHSDADRDTYLAHPSHLEFVEWVGGWIEKVVVFDYHCQ